MREPSISIQFVNAVIENCHDRPQQLRELLSRNHISPGLLEQDGARVAAGDYANLVRDTMLLLEDESLGYGSAPQPLGSWEMMCQTAISAETLGEALRRCSRFYRLIDWGIAPRMLRDGDIAQFALEPLSGAAAMRPYLYESFLFYVHRLANWLIAEQIPLHHVDFNFSRPPYAEEYRYLFLASELRYEQPVTAISFAQHYLHYPLQQNQDTLREFLQHPNHAMIAQDYQQHSWHNRVRNLLAQRLADNPSYADIAEQLGKHPQTLRRQLRREGFQYQEIKDRVRRDTAIHLLSKRRKSVEETAALSGFSEPSSFIRSFKRWTGVTPYTYRKGRNGAASGDADRSA